MGDQLGNVVRAVPGGRRNLGGDLRLVECHAGCRRDQCCVGSNLRSYFTTTLPCWWVVLLCWISLQRI
jgi:hypothetical protein